MKILILNPPVFKTRFSREGRCQTREEAWLDVFPPVTLPSIASVVRKKYKVKLVDCIGAKISPTTCLDIIKNYQPDFVVMNTSTSTINSDLEIARIIKNVAKPQIILYGEFVTAMHKYIFKKYPFIDYIALSEPETPVMRILEGEIKSRGIATKDWNGGLWIEPDLDKLPFPAYELLPNYHFPLTGERWLFLRSGRGCPFRCVFCVEPFLSGNKPRYHSPEYMYKQLKWVVKKCNVHLFMFWDELATLDKERMMKLCELIIKSKLHRKIKWFCTTRVDKIDEELIKKMAKAGCRMVSFGIESGDQEILNKVKKNVSLDQIKTAVKITRQMGVKTIGHFIIGLPGSSEKSEKMTCEFATKLGLDFAQFYIATPFPASEFYKLARRKKWIIKNPMECMEQKIPVVSYPQFSSDRIIYWRKRAFFKFYCRLNIVKSILSLAGLRGIFRFPFYGIKFFRWII